MITLTTFGVAEVADDGSIWVTDAYASVPDPRWTRAALACRRREVTALVEDRLPDADPETAEATVEALLGLRNVAEQTVRSYDRTDASDAEFDAAVAAAEADCATKTEAILANVAEALAWREANAR